MIELINGDCFEVMPILPAGKISLVLTDPPYSKTKNDWDGDFDLGLLWSNLERAASPNAAFVFTAVEPFTSKLVLSKSDLFRFDYVWEKTIASGQLNIARQPLRAHESVLVFTRGSYTYNEQKTEGEPYTRIRPAMGGGNYGAQRATVSTNPGFRHSRSVIRVSNPRVKEGHPTQKPVALLEHIIRTFTNPGDTVLDPFMGSGSTGVACRKLGRNFIGIEIGYYWYARAEQRLMCNEQHIE